MRRGQKLRHAYAGSKDWDQTYQTKNAQNIWPWMYVYIYIFFKKRDQRTSASVAGKKWKGLTRETVPWSENEDTWEERRAPLSAICCILELKTCTVHPFFQGIHPFLVFTDFCLVFIDATMVFINFLMVFIGFCPSLCWFRVGLSLGNLVLPSFPPSYFFIDPYFRLIPNMFFDLYFWCLCPWRDKTLR